MSEEIVSRELALENVLIMAERLALLHYAFAKTLEQELPEEAAKRLTLKAIDEYGRLAAKSVMEKIDGQRLKPTLSNFKHGKDLPSMGWKFVPIAMPAEKPKGKISKITYCPLADTWAKLGADGERLGRLYCGVDQAKYKAYGKGYRCFHDQNALDGDGCCIIRVEQDGPEDSFGE
jgi:hypothetical protein